MDPQDPKMQLNLDNNPFIVKDSFINPNTNQTAMTPPGGPLPPPSYQASMNIDDDSNVNDQKKHYASSVSKPDPLIVINDEHKFISIMHKYEISIEFAERLKLLENFKIVFIFDDSGSMNTQLSESPLNISNNLFKAKRWDELQFFAKISIEIAALFDAGGSDVFFLNRPKAVKVTKPSELVPSFKEPPGGFTPLARVLNEVLEDNRALADRKLLIIIATDGEPTDDSGKAAISEFKKTLQNRLPINRIYTSIVACTDDSDSVRYLNKLDKKLPHLDVVDDYRNEREEVKKIMGSNYRFTYGDYVVKSLIGSVDPNMDKMDETGCCLTS